MKPHSTLLKICLAISTLCLAAGYLSSGYWQVLLVFPALALSGYFVAKRSDFWPASIFLLVYVSLAALGILSGLSRFLMLVAGTTALASWELMLFKQQQVEISLIQSDHLLENNHLKTLALATGAGLVLVLIISGVSLDLPFIAAAVLALVLFGGFLLGVRS